MSDWFDVICETFSWNIESKNCCAILQALIFLRTPDDEHCPWWFVNTFELTTRNRKQGTTFHCRTCKHFKLSQVLPILSPLSRDFVSSIICLCDYHIYDLLFQQKLSYQFRSLLYCCRSIMTAGLSGAVKVAWVKWSWSQLSAKLSRGNHVKP